MKLTLDNALDVVSVARKRASATGVQVTVAVVDAGGNLLAFIADEEAMLAARDLAISKAYTALSLKRPSGDLAEFVGPDGPFFGLNTALNGKPIITFAGGVPLGDPIVGAVGVSGGTLDEDRDISQHAADYFNNKTQ